jgi:hypothetical protein
MIKSIKIAFLMSFVFFNTSQAQILENFISKSMSLRGGKERILNVQTLVIEGEIKKGTQKVPIKIFIKNKDGYKHEYEVNGKKDLLIVNKNESWKGENLSNLIKNDEALHQYYMSFMDLNGDFFDMDIKSKYEFIDFETINNIEYLRINKIDMMRNLNATLYYSNTDFMKFKEIFQNITNGNEEMYTYSNYKKTEYGMMMPFNFNIGFGEITVLKYTFNKIFDKRLFLPELEAENNTIRKTPVQTKERN